MGTHTLLFTPLNNTRHCGRNRGESYFVRGNLAPLAMIEANLLICQPVSYSMTIVKYCEIGTFTAPDRTAKSHPM